MSREAFEKWYAEEMGEPNVRRYADSRGVYTHLAMQSAWLGWQAALESQAAQKRYAASDEAEHIATVIEGDIRFVRGYPAAAIIRAFGLQEGDKLYAHPAQPKVPEGYAGCMIWIGDNIVRKVVTRESISQEIVAGNSITHAAQECLDQLAASQEKNKIDRD